MTKTSRRAFTLVEVMIVFFIVAAAITISVTATIALNQDYKILMSYLTSYLKGREVMEEISKDCRMAVRVMDSYAGYTTTSGCIVLKVPSIDSSGNIIDVNKIFDYIIYRVMGQDLWKTVIPDLSSSRSPYNGILKKSIESLYMESNGVPVSDIAHKSSIMHITVWVAISETVLGKDYRIIPGTTIKLMNYEWEYVR